MTEKIEQASAGVASVLNAELDRAATMNIIKCVVPIKGVRKCCKF